jgi:hypothetical protein
VDRAEVDSCRNLGSSGSKFDACCTFLIGMSLWGCSMGCVDMYYMLAVKLWSPM